MTRYIPKYQEKLRPYWRIALLDYVFEKFT